MAAMCLVLGLLSGLLVAQSTRSKPQPAWFTPPRVQAPALRLRDQDGHWASLRGERGKVVVVTFLYSTCRWLCPAQAAEIADAVTRVHSKDVEVLGVSVDPVGDTPERVHAFIEHNGLTGAPVRYLVGTRAELRPVWARFGIVPIGASKQEAEAAAAGYEFERRDPAAYQKGTDEYKDEYKEYSEESAPDAAKQPFPSSTDEKFRGMPRHRDLDFEHTAYVLLIDRQGRQRVGFPFEQLTP